jgi:cytochrome c oxidase accessory protein FixG
VLLVVLLGTPWVQIGGRPAILLDIPHRQFFLLGQSYNAQDAFLLFFLLTGVGFALALTTSLFGRIWCGFACPQTVLVDGVFRRIERWIEGPREARIKLDRAPMSAGKALRKIAKHSIFAILSLLLAHVLLGYFFPIRELGAMLLRGPRLHLEAFVWTTCFAGLVYFDCAWFREQFCVIMCPYGRLQSALTDRDTLVIGYDVKRGEPRGKLKVLGNGDCVDCKRCVTVCPTGIDIRQGLQLDCIGCGACVDACDEVMLKVEKPKGLIRFDSERGFAGEKTRFVRPRTIGYVAAGAVGLAVFAFSLASRGGFESSLLRPMAAPYTVEGGELRNVLRLRLVSKRSSTASFHIEPVSQPELSVVVSQPDVSLPALGSIEIPVIATMPVASFHGSFPLQLRVSQGGSERLVSVQLLGPGR